MSEIGKENRIFWPENRKAGLKTWAAHPRHKFQGGPLPLPLPLPPRKKGQYLFSLYTSTVRLTQSNNKQIRYNYRYFQEQL